MDMASFFVRVWFIDPDLIPCEAMLIVPEPEDILILERQVLRYRVQFHVLEDWSPPAAMLRVMAVRARPPPAM
jgi:hypothetical protein